MSSEDLTSYQVYGMPDRLIKDMVATLALRLPDMRVTSVCLNNGLGFVVTPRGMYTDAVLMAYDYKTRLFDLKVHQGSEVIPVEGQHTVEQAAVIIKMEL